MKKGLAILLSFLMVLSLALPGSLTIHAEEMVNVENVKTESELPENYDTDISMLTVDEGNSEDDVIESDEDVNTTENSSKTTAAENEVEESNTSTETGESDSKFEDFLKMVEKMPSIDEIDQMNEDEIDDVVDKYYNLLDVYDELTEEEQEKFSEEYSDLYTFVFDDLGIALSEKLNSGIEVMSLLPLEERRAYLVVGSHDGIDISAVPIDIVLENLRDSKGNIIDLPSNAKIVWSYYKDKNDNVISDDYFELKKGGTLDLSIFEEYDRYSMEMIVGDGNQLSPDNIRYIVTVYLTDSVGGLRTYEWYTQDADGTRHKVEPADSRVTAISMGSDHVYIVPDHVEGREYYLGVKDPIDEHPFVQLDVVSYADYMGVIMYQALGLGEYPYTNLADQMVNQNMKKPNAGYKKTWDVPEQESGSVNVGNMFGFIYKNSLSGTIVKSELVQFSIVNDMSGFDDAAYSDGKDVKLTSEQLVSLDEIKDSVFNVTADDLTYIKRVFLKEGYSADASYQYALLAHSTIWENANAHVIKAVKGSYHSLDEVAGLEDISDQLLPKDGSKRGYLANYDIAKGGQVFTVFFDDNTVFRILVVFQEYDKNADVHYVREYSDVPLVGEADPWFRISGATDVNGADLNTYVIENGKRNNIDTMYGYGYQAVFINEAVDKFIPKFWKVNDEAISLDNIYVNGKIYNEGDALSFESGSNELDAVFSVIITDKKGPHTKNYSVKFVKKANGPKLYVAGPLAPDVRSIFLDEHHENKHDIFIANVGDAPLTDLWLDLDATNVELDSYWTVGGEGNNTLAACPADFNKALMESDYGEQPNIAKIRLVPPTTGKGGEISGTLKIYSGTEGNPGNSELLATIILSDLAQNPEITTDALDDAVLYVPYSYLITTNNMYDWVDVSYEIVEGSLPNGVELIESTGEIYGVPLETGDFNVKIATHFNSTSANYAFTPSTVELTLTVLDNTNANVYNATDMAEGYQILDAIGTDEGGYDFVLYTIEDTIYRSNGEFGEFVDLWLNGEKLTRGVDYDAESGSTKITIYSETFDNKANQSGRNTIAAEFRTTDTSSKNNTDNTNQLNRTSQNFRINTTCTHSYNSGVITKAATCTVAGVRTYTCTKCGATKTESIAATGHSYNSGKVTTEATCTATGVKTYTCTKCGGTKTETIAAKGHSVKITTTDATCVKNGLKESKCTVCGTITKTEIIPATGHNYDNGVITKKATCTDDGVKTYTCANCKDKYTEVVRATGHSYDVGVITKEVTCTDDGVKTYTCANCKDSYEEKIPATGHNYNVTITKEPTAKTEGEKTYTCTTCKDSFKETIPALGDDHVHVYDSGVVTKEATCLENGQKTFKCTICEESYSETILATGHTYNSGTVKEKATCTDKGVMEYICEICKESYESEIPALGHSYGTGIVKTEATCTEKGLVEYVCTECQTEYSEEVPATGHAYDEGVVTKEPTYDVTGIKTYTCQSCGETMTEVIPVKERPNTPNPDNGNGNGTNNNGTDNGNGTAETANTLTCSIKVLSADGMSLNGMTLELHSTPQSAILGEDGFAKFNPIEFGEHTIILKDKDGNVLAEKHITVNAGMSFAVNGDIVTAVRGSNCTLTVRYNGDGTMTLVSIQGTDSPQTGDDSHLNIYLMIMMLALIALGSMIIVKRRKRY